MEITVMPFCGVLTAITAIRTDRRITALIPAQTGQRFMPMIFCLVPGDPLPQAPNPAAAAYLLPAAVLPVAAAVAVPVRPKAQAIHHLFQVPVQAAALRHHQAVHRPHLQVRLHPAAQALVQPVAVRQVAAQPAALRPVPAVQALHHQAVQVSAAQAPVQAAAVQVLRLPAQALIPLKCMKYGFICQAVGFKSSKHGG